MIRLIGHDVAARALIAATGGGRLHHAWLLVGPEGVGKARFATLAAARLLAAGAGQRVDPDSIDISDDHPTMKLIAAGSHPDFMRLERLEREAKGGRAAGLARNISVDQVRSLHRLFDTAGSFSSRRVAVIDSVDELEPAGANALLKSLEEPPEGALFLLVSHAPGRLLPTIRSRCRTLRFSRLSDADTKDVLRAELPESNEAGIAALVAVAEGAPGRGLAYAGLDIAGLDGAIDRLIARGDAGNGERIRLARALGPKPAQERYRAFLDRAPQRIAAHARTQSGVALERAIEAWEEANALADRAIRVTLDPQATVFTMGGILAGLAR